MLTARVAVILTCEMRVNWNENRKIENSIEMRNFVATAGISIQTAEIELAR